MARRRVRCSECRKQIWCSRWSWVSNPDNDFCLCMRCYYETPSLRSLIVFHMAEALLWRYERAKSGAPA